jgi:transposase
MQMITTVGLDIAKSVFQVHGVDAGGQVRSSMSTKCRPSMPLPILPIDSCARSAVITADELI